VATSVVAGVPATAEPVALLSTEGVIAALACLPESAVAATFVFYTSAGFFVAVSIFAFKSSVFRITELESIFNLPL
jgi:hypothetical protein